MPGVTTSTCHGILKASSLCFLQDRSMLLLVGCLPRPAAQTRDVGLHVVAIAGSELSECILRYRDSTVATRVHGIALARDHMISGIAKKDGRGV